MISIPASLAECIHMRRKSMKRKDYWIAAVFLLPAISLLVIFVIYPIISNAILSFQSWNGIFSVKKSFVGIEN